MNTIQFQNANGQPLTGTISLQTELPALTVSMTITGPGMNNLFVTRSGAAGTPDFRIFTVWAQCAITGLNIVNGHPDGDGAAIYNHSSWLSLNSVDIDHNVTTGQGGGIYNAQGATLTVTSSQIFSNSARDGAGIANAGTLWVLDGTLISANSATNDGGGVFNDTGAGATISGNGIQISSNTALNGAGVESTGVLAMNGPSITANIASGAGGGIYYEGGNVEAQIQNVYLSQNGAFDGGGFFVSGSMSLTGCTVSGNTATGEGPGGFLTVGSFIEDSNCTITDRVYNMPG